MATTPTREPKTGGHTAFIGTHPSDTNSDRCDLTITNSDDHSVAIVEGPEYIDASVHATDADIIATATKNLEAVGWRVAGPWRRVDRDLAAAIDPATERADD
jgi:hypothetical protein